MAAIVLERKRKAEDFIDFIEAVSQPLTKRGKASTGDTCTGIPELPQPKSEQTQGGSQLQEGATQLTESRAVEVAKSVIESQSKLIMHTSMSIFKNEEEVQADIIEKFDQLRNLLDKEQARLIFQMRKNTQEAIKELASHGPCHCQPQQKFFMDYRRVLDTLRNNVLIKRGLIGLDLPPDVIEQILSYGSEHERRSWRQVCTWFRTAVDKVRERIPTLSGEQPFTFTVRGVSYRAVQPAPVPVKSLVFSASTTKETFQCCIEANINDRKSGYLGLYFRPKQETIKFAKHITFRLLDPCNPHIPLRVDSTILSKKKMAKNFREDAGYGFPMFIMLEKLRAHVPDDLFTVQVEFADA